MHLSKDLRDAEDLMRTGDPKCLERYKSLVVTFQSLNDYDTSSYFQGKCLNFSIEHKFKMGEIDALIGLGICEEKVYQEKKAKDYLEQALNKAIEAQDQKGINKVSKELMRIYDEIATEYQL